MFDYYKSRIEETYRELTRRKERLAIFALVGAVVLWAIWLSVAQGSGELKMGDAGTSAGGSVKSTPDPAEVKDLGQAKKKNGRSSIYVHVAGAVRDPGLLKLSVGARADAAVAAAGGMLASADPLGVNLARKLKDGEQLIVPYAPVVDPSTQTGATGGAVISSNTKGTGQTGTASSPQSAITADGLVDINLASAEELDDVPGIGPVLAERIVSYREKNGPFTSVEGLNDVSGIGDKKFEDMSPYVVVR